MSLDNTLLVEVIIAHGQPTPAHVLHEGTPFIFGGFVWHVADVEFVGDTMREVKITMVRYDASGKALAQTMTVSKEFELQTLWLTQHKGKDTEILVVEDKVSNTYDPDDPKCTCPGSTDPACPSHGDPNYSQPPAI